MYLPRKILAGDTISTSPTGNGAAIRRGHQSHSMVQPLMSLKPWVLIRPQDTMRPPPLQSSALPIKLILPRIPIFRFYFYKSTELFLFIYLFIYLFLHHPPQMNSLCYLWVVFSFYFVTRIFRYSCCCCALGLSIITWARGRICLHRLLLCK